MVKSKKGRYKYWCRPENRAERDRIQRERTRHWMVQNKERDKITTQLRIVPVKEWIYNYKLEHPCVHCGEANPVQLIFHHVIPEDKKFSISSGVYSGRNINSIKLEIDKCVVLCKKCHVFVHGCIGWGINPLV